MRKYFFAFAVLAVAAILITVLCLFSFKPVPTLLNPPMLSGENTAVQLAFEKSVKGEYRLKAPIDGDNHSAYIFEDVNDDGQDEVFVFYSGEGAINLVRVNFLIKEKGEWISVSDYESSYSDIHQVCFSDLDNDGIKELLIGWYMHQNNLSRSLDIIKLNPERDGYLRSIYSCSYSEFEIIDIDSDNKEDVAVFDKNGSTLKYELSFLQADSSEISIKDTIELDSTATAILGICEDYDYIDRGTRIYVDIYRSDSGICTDCIGWDSDKKSFFRQTVDNNNSIPALTSRNINVLCSDIDEDSFIEIPCVSLFNNSRVIYSTDAEAEPLNIVNWMNLVGGSTELKCSSFIYNNDFSVELSDEWLEGLSILCDYTTETIYFYEYDSLASFDAVEKTPLFELRYITNQEQEDTLSDNYKLLTETSKGKLFYKYRNLTVGSFDRYELERSIIY